MVKRSHGLAYLGLLALVAVMSAALAGVAPLWSMQARREREEALLNAGEQVRRAIGAYYLATPGNVKRYPRALEELLEDPRQAVLLRHLRRIPCDPLGGKADWELLRAADGGIMGVASRAPGQPQKRSGFTEAQASFATANHYSDWKFIYQPPDAAGVGIQALSGSRAARP